MVLSPQFFTPHPYFPKGGGQGKFFADPKPVDEHRYQRGYTPERMNEVRNGRVAITPGVDPKGVFGGPGGAHRILETLARSTTPVDELTTGPARPMAHINTASPLTADDFRPLRVLVRNNPKAAAARGTYEEDTRFSRGTIHLAPNVESEQRASQTLLHELGHYKSLKVEGNASSWYGRIPAETGREEARADDNMVRRWRPDPRDVRRGKGAPPAPTYEWRGSFRGLGGGAAYGPYLTARTTLSKESKKRMRSTGERDRPVEERAPQTFKTPDGRRYTLLNPKERGGVHAQYAVEAPLIDHRTL